MQKNENLLQESEFQNNYAKNALQVIGTSPMSQNLNNRQMNYNIMNDCS